MTFLQSFVVGLVVSFLIIKFKKVHIEVSPQGLIWRILALFLIYVISSILWAFPIYLLTMLVRSSFDI